MNDIDHSFDWRGITFTLKVMALCLAIGAGAHYAFLYIQSESASESLVQEQDVSNVTLALASTTSERAINALTIPETVPQIGKFIAADLTNMKLYLYENGTATAEYPIVMKGKQGTPWETPSGFYNIQTKEENHFSTIGKVYMPFSMQFYGNYFIHGQTYYPDGTPTSATFSGGCIKLETEDAKKVFAFADRGTKVFVYDAKQSDPLPPLELYTLPKPQIDADAYLIADMDTGNVYAEKNATEKRPIASVTKLMTALVANEIISFDKKLSVPQGSLVNPPNLDDVSEKVFSVGDLLYPLLMQSSNGVADSLASYYGSKGFVGWMNTTATALDMTSTTYADTSGISPENISTPEDLFRLAVYLANKKSFVLNITRTQTKTLTAEDGSEYSIKNVNAPANTSPFQGGKVGHTRAAEDTIVSVLSLKVGDATRRMAIIVLGSSDQIQDTKNLAEWITNAANHDMSQAGCMSCAQSSQFRKIEL